MTSKRSSEIGITYASFDDVPSGVDCEFVIVGGRGLKVYRNAAKRDRFHRAQKSLASKGLAPAVDGCIDIVMDDDSVKYGYWSIVADIAIHNDYTFTDWGRRAGKTNSVIKRDKADLSERLGRAGYHWSDQCDFNFGYINGRAVLTDCDV